MGIARCLLKAADYGDEMMTPIHDERVEVEKL